MSRYTARIDLAEVNDAHVLAIGRVPANSKVLDLGCADGSVAATLRRLGCRVWGVERDPTDAAQARSVCERVVEADLEDLDFGESFDGVAFDVVLMLDVLEHLPDPAAVLERVGRVLAPTGWGVISLPNIAHVSTRLSLLSGRFRYTDVGLLDRTHLRFFDRHGVDELLESAGWQMFDLTRVTRRLGQTEIPDSGDHPELADQLQSDPEALTYQFVVSAAPAGSVAANDPPLLPAAITQNLVMELVAELESTRSAVKASTALVEELEAARYRINAHDALLRDLLGRLEGIRAGSLARRGHLGSLLEALEENTERLRRSVPG